MSIASGSTTRANTDWTYNLPTTLNGQVIRFNFTGGFDFAVVYEMGAYGTDTSPSGVPEPASGAWLPLG